MQRAKVIQSRMNEPELSALQAIANREHTTVSEVVRQLVRSEAKRLNVWPESKAKAKVKNV